MKNKIPFIQYKNKLITCTKFNNIIKIPDECTTYMQYITRFKKRLLADLMRAFPEAQIDEDCALWDAFNNIIYCFLLRHYQSPPLLESNRSIILTYQQNI